MLGKIYTHCLGCNLVITNGLECTAISRVNKQNNKSNKDTNENNVTGGTAEVRITLKKV